MTIAKYYDMILFSIADRHTLNFCPVARLFKESRQLLTLVHIDVSSFHSEAL